VRVKVIKHRKVVLVRFQFIVSLYHQSWKINWNKKSTNNNESEISENLPKSSNSQISNDQLLMEEIKELQTRENFESNPLEFGHKKQSIKDIKVGFNRQVSFKDKNKFINHMHGEKILGQLKRPRELAPVMGTLKKWSKGSRLGFGAYGDVIKAIDRTNGSVFAVK